MKCFQIILSILITSPLLAQDYGRYGMEEKDLPEGISIGKRAPEFTAVTADGDDFVLRQALAEGPVVLMFYRGNWCPYCSKQLNNLSDSLSYILAMGATVVAVSPESLERLKETQASNNSQIVFIADEKNHLMKAYDVDFKVTDKYQHKLDRFGHPNLEEFNQQEDAVLPVPATYVLNQNGEIIYRYFDINYKSRAPVSQILKALEQ